MGDDAATVEQLRAELAASRRRETELRVQVEHLRPALTEAREQQAAMTEILRAIVASGGDASAVLATIAEQATRIGRASDTLLYRLDGDTVSLVAHHGPLVMPSGSRAATFPASERRVVTAAIRARGPVHVPDFQAVAAERFPDTWVHLRETDEAATHRTWLGVPF